MLMKVFGSFLLILALTVEKASRSAVLADEHFPEQQFRRNGKFAEKRCSDTIIAPLQ
jgi:hypothetical protein